MTGSAFRPSDVISKFMEHFEAETPEVLHLILNVPARQLTRMYNGKTPPREYWERIYRVAAERDIDLTGIFPVEQVKNKVEARPLAQRIREKKYSAEEIEELIDDARLAAEAAARNADYLRELVEHLRAQAAGTFDEKDEPPWGKSEPLLSDVMEEHGFTLTQIEAAGQFNATPEEMAAYIDVPVKDVRHWLEVHPDFARAYERGQQKARLKLRQTQFKLAEKNAPMAIFLGKTMLGQEDKQSVSLTGKDGGPIEVREKLKSDLLSLAGQLTRKGGISNDLSEDEDGAAGKKGSKNVG